MGEVMPNGIMLWCCRFASLMQCFSCVKSIVYSIWVSMCDLLLHLIWVSMCDLLLHLIWVSMCDLLSHLIGVDTCIHVCSLECDICTTIRINIGAP